MAVLSLFPGTCVLHNLFAVALITFGGIHKDDCPADRFVPMYFIIIGGLFICLGLSLTLVAAQFKTRNPIVYVPIVIYNDIVIACLVVMLTYGTFRVWNVDLDIDHPASKRYCDSSVYEVSRGLSVGIYLWCILLVYFSYNLCKWPTENREGARQNLLGSPSINIENSSPPNYHSVAISSNKPTVLPKHDL